ncbi:class I SAM-dependent methyltransferase [Candidatus Thioglobus sp.]|nr:class I SAM-dependent methyltransferase [Candidatus Thioglobus sp.]
MIQKNSIKCGTCGELNIRDSLFCSKCISALNVKKLSDLTADDLIASTIGLINSINQSTDFSDVVTNTDNEILASYLSAFWLRPETALYQTAEARIVSPLLSQYENEIILDIGCGNGVNTSLIAGWRFPPDFDVFSNLGLDLDDIYDNPLNKVNSVEFYKKGRVIDYGVDIKRSMVQRSQSLGSFNQVLQADVADIPIDDGIIGAVYSNVLRDFKGEVLHNALSECNRLLQSNGVLIFSTPTETYRDKLYYYSKAKELENKGDLDGAKYHLMLDRGRSEYCSQQISIDDWGKILERHGFEILDTYPFAGKQLTNLWDTGLRPYTPLLARFLESVSNNSRYELKSAIINFLINFLYKVLKNDIKTKDPAFMVVHAKKL